MFLGLQIWNSIPRYEKENKAFWKASMHLNIKILIRPGLLGSWGMREGWFQD